MHLFQYHSLPSHQWEKELSAFRNEEPIEIRIDWSRHHQTFAHVDFSSSRLRLEYLLNLCKGLKKQVMVRVNLFSSGSSYPHFLSLNKDTIVPLVYLSGSSFGYHLSEVPDLMEQSSIQALKRFMSALLSLMSQYQDVLYHKKVFVDCSLVDGYARFSQSRIIEDYFNERYQSVEEFNRVYNLSFRALKDAYSGDLFKLLCDKRPWIASYDFIGLKSHYKKKLFNFIEKKDLLDTRCFQFQESKKKLLILDSSILSHNGEAIFPMIVSGHILKDSLLYYKRAKKLLSLIGQDVDVCSSSVLDTCRSIDVYDEVYYYGDKYISKRDFDLLRHYGSRGNKLYFINSIPTYDENFNVIEWGAQIVRTEGVLGDTYCCGDFKATGS